MIFSNFEKHRAIFFSKNKIFVQSSFKKFYFNSNTLSARVKPANVQIWFQKKIVTTSGTHFDQKHPKTMKIQKKHVSLVSCDIDVNRKAF